MHVAAAAWLPVIGQQVNRASCSLECAVILTHAAQGPVTNTNEEVVTVTVTAVTCVALSMRGYHRHYTHHSDLAHVT